MCTKRIGLQRDLEAKGLRDVSDYALKVIGEWIKEHPSAETSLEEVREITGRVCREYGVTLSQEVGRMRAEE